jgi:hypothetical protein
LSRENWSNLENDSNELVYRIWIEPDLVIEVGQQVTITLSSEKYDKKKKEYVIGNVKKIKSDINSQTLLRHFDSLNLGEWKDAISSEGIRATGEINNGHRVLIEFSTKEKYRSFSLYGPLTDQSEKSKPTLELINFLDEQIDPDKMRIDYYGQMASTDKDAKRLCKSIAEYKEYYREQIDKKISKNVGILLNPFDNSDHGHMGLFGGRIKDITRVMVTRSR